MDLQEDADDLLIYADALDNFFSNPYAMVFYLGPIVIFFLIFLGLGLYILFRKKPYPIDQAIAEIDQQSHTSEESTDPSIDSDLSSRSLSSSLTDDKVEHSKSYKIISKTQWLEKLKQSIHQSRDLLGEGLNNLLSEKKSLDKSLEESLLKLFYQADLGVEVSQQLINYVKSSLDKKDSDFSLDNIKSLLSSKLRTYLYQDSISSDNGISSKLSRALQEKTPYVLIIVGVNGVGKTTSVAKLGGYFQNQLKKTVVLSAADTFRAGAINQLTIWSQRLGVEIVKHQPGADPGAVVYDSISSAKSKAKEVLIVDTAGRLHTKDGLMQEVGKIIKVIEKKFPEINYDVWQVIDGTTGRNSIKQVESFSQVVPLSGLIVTKLDGTAKGGAMISISHQFQLPVKFIGIGEKVEHFQSFDRDEFVDNLLQKVQKT